MPNEPQDQSPGRFDPGEAVATYGCAGQHSEAALQQASTDFQKVKEDSNVLRIAPKDVIPRR